MSTNSLGLTTPSVSFTGLSSGIDTASIVSKLMQLERQPITKLQQDKNKLSIEKAAIQSLNTKIQALRDKSGDLLTGTAFALRTATSSTTTVATATASASAARGSFDVNVTALAKAHTMASGGTSTSAGLGSLPADGQTLDVTIGGTTHTVTFTGADTLQKVVDQINGQIGDAVSASAVTVKDALTGTSYQKLMLVSDTTGSGGAMTVAGTAAAGLNLSDTQAGEDAQLTVNSVPVTASGNTVDGAISGVTLNLAGLGRTVVTVDSDSSGIQDKVQAFVDAYNALVNEVHDQTKYDKDTKTAGTLQGDQSISSFLGQLRGLVGGQVTALDGQKYDSLAQIGITSDKTGLLTLDATKFKAALADDAAKVASVFTQDDGGTTKDLADGIAVRIKDFANSFSPDVLAKRLTGYSDRTARLDKKIADLEIVMDMRETRMKAQFAAMEEAVSKFQSEASYLSSQLA